MSEGLIAIGVVLLVAWAWLDTAQARDRARFLAGRLCRDIGVQFLDQTVALRRTFLLWGDGLSIGREFRFEFSEDGVDRYEGRLTLHGRKLAQAVLDGGDTGRTIIQPE